ncbi:[NiFe] hydrogenase metallocenter assembly protein HypD [Minicystis rosea]|nr:[NiFe] hydrogenase metallocenter assembly protein HypD [Minicystis rosea]
MKYLDEYRDGTAAQRIAQEIRAEVTKPWVLMEVCGGQTHSIVRYGIDGMLPPEIELVHGPGCPVCVTSLEAIDRAHAIAARPDVIFTSFGDMLRVPGSSTDLLALRGRGADVRVVYSPLDALSLARHHPERHVVFFGIGFETTAPANAMALFQAKRQGLTNFSMLLSHVLVPPAIACVLSAPDNRVQAFLGPGHVCAVTGYRPYEALVERHRVPIVITGFEPVDLLHGVLLAVRQLEAGRHDVENAYARMVTRDGNLGAQRIVDEVFEVTDRKWRGVGFIPASGYRIRDAYRAHDAERLFDVGDIQTCEASSCISGLVLRGAKKPTDCPAFGRACTPETPLGATMVSAEGACAAYFQYGRGRPLSPRMPRVEPDR